MADGLGVLAGTAQYRCYAKITETIQFTPAAWAKAKAKKKLAERENNHKPSQ